MTVFKITPLDWRSPIVDLETGAPSLQFIRLWQQLFGNVDSAFFTASTALSGLDDKVDKTTQVIAGTGLTGGGTLDADVTLNIDTTAEAERIRDVIGTALVAGSNITITVNDGADTITIAAASSVNDLDDLGDVNAPSPADGDILVYDNAAGEWVTAQPSGGGMRPLVNGENPPVFIINVDHDLIMGAI
jgi:hypothetical protein